MKKVNVLILLAFVLVGCVNNKIIDDIDIQAGSAFDELEEGEVIGAILIQNYLPDKTVENKVLKTKGQLRRDILLNVQKKTSGELSTGGLVITIFGDKLADNGIIDFVDAYQRDASIGARNYLVTSSENALEILEGNYGPKGTSKYLQDLLAHNIKYRDIPTTNLHIFLRDYYMEGKDPYLPEIKKISEDEVKVSGISLFKGDKEVHVLHNDDMFYFKLLADNHSKGTMKIHLKKGVKSAVRSIKSKRSFNINKKDRSLIDIQIHIKGEVREYTGGKLTTKIVKKVAKKFEKNIEKESLKLIKQFQSEGIDPLGFGQLHIRQIRGYNFNNWEEDYQNLSFNIEAEVDIVQTGVIE